MRTFWNWFRAEFRNRVLTGIVVVVPIGATWLVLRILFRRIDHLASPWVRRIFHIDFPGLGFLLTMIAVYGAGLFATNVLGKKIIQWIEESILGRVPLVRTLYQAFKKLMVRLSLPGSQSFKKVVFIEFPRPGIQALGFVTGETKDPTTGGKLLNVFIPTVPSPATGLLQLVPEENVIVTDISVEEAMRTIVSGGFLAGERLFGSSI